MPGRGGSTSCVELGAEGIGVNFSGYGAVLSAGLEVPPDGSVGYAHGSFFSHVDGSGESDSLYLNSGDGDSSRFAKLSTSIHQAATVSALSSVRPKDGDLVSVLGYYSAGDGGGQALYYNASSSATVDGGFVFNGPGSVGRYIAIDQNIATARRFGAKGDDVTDDTDVIQAAIDAAITAGGKLIIEPGDYLIEGVLTVADGVTSGNVHITGSTHGSSNLNGSGTGDATLVLKGTSTRIILENLCIDGNSSKDHGLLIDGSLTTESIFRCLRLLPGSTSNLGVADDAVALSMSWYGITVSGGPYGLWFPELTTVQNLKVYGYRASNTGAGGTGAAIYSRNTTSGQPNVEFYGATIEGNRGRALDHLGGAMIRFVGGHVEGNNKDDTTHLRGEFEVGGGHSGQVVSCQLLFSGLRFGSQFGTQTNPRVRIASTHTVVQIRDTNFSSSDHISADASTSTGSCVFISGCATRIGARVGTQSFRVIQDPSPNGTVTISNTDTSSVVNVSTWRPVGTGWFPVGNVISTTGTPAAGSSEVSFSAVTRGSIGAISKTATGPTITDAADPEQSRPTFSDTFILEITTGGALGTAQYRYSEDNGGSWSSPTTLSTSGRVRLSNGVRLDCPAGTYELNEQYSTTATASSFTANLEVAPGAGDTVTIGWQLVRPTL